MAAPARPYTWVRVSPDGAHVAMEVQGPGNTDIWIYDLRRGTSTRLTTNPGPDRWPLWTPDGRRIVFASGSDLVWKAADGTGDEERLVTGLPLSPRPYAWSKDAGNLVYDQDSSIGSTFLLPVNGDRRPQALIASEFRNNRPAVSSVGRWIAYISNESGRDEIYVRPFPVVGSGRWPVSTAGGTSPKWSPDGDAIFYHNLSDALMRVPVSSGASFNAGAPAVLFKGSYLWGVGGNGRPYDIAPDGQRILMIKEDAVTRSNSRQMIVVQNWFEELRRRVPGR